ncbi:MAG: hypothetical protein V4673_00955 [Pseudomonadota bacterium]
MTSLPTEILDKIATPADLASFLLGFGVGFAMDAFAILGGIPTVDPITAGLGSGALILGAKQAVVSWSSRRMAVKTVQVRVELLIQLAKEQGVAKHLDLIASLKSISRIAETANLDIIRKKLDSIEETLISSQEIQVQQATVISEAEKQLLIRSDAALTRAKQRGRKP